MAYAIVTGCTNRKQAPPSETLCAHTLSSGSLDEVTMEWVGRTGNARDALPAGKLYVGRGFQEARKAAQALDATHFIVSAGLGLVTTDELVPPYSLTITRGSDDCILSKLPTGVTPTDWWTSLTNGLSVTSRLDKPEFSTVVVALAREYLRMVVPLLEATARITNLRILTRGDHSFLPGTLQIHCITYDDRLDGQGSTNAGTLSDFITRSARHFSEQVLSAHPNGSLSQHQATVDQSLSAFPERQIPDRQKTSDEEIKTIIDKDWDVVGGRSGKMLRRLRDELLIACEQSRFKDLFHEVAAQRLKT
jgi:hypothetical protein